MTTLTDPRGKDTGSPTPANRISQVTRADATTEDWSPHQLDDWVGDGQRHLPGAGGAVLAAASATGITNGRGLQPAYRFDWTGFGEAVGDIDELGEWPQRTPTPTARPWRRPTGLNRNELLQHDSHGNVTSDRHATGRTRAVHLQGLAVGVGVRCGPLAQLVDVADRLAEPGPVEAVGPACSRGRW